MRDLGALRSLFTAAQAKRYSDSIRKQMRAHNKALEPLVKGRSHGIEGDWQRLSLALCGFVQSVGVPLRDC